MSTIFNTTGASSHSFSEPTVMQVDLNALTHNLIKFRSVLSPTTKLMMMIKAWAYGTGVEQIGQWAERTQMIDYLSVAYIAEGIELRESAISLPIMVINIENIDFDTCRIFNLEPVIYSISLFKQLVDWLQKNQERTFPCIHVKVNTGMNRLGLNVDEISEFLSILSKCTCCRLTIKSIYSHVAASDDPKEDDYTAEQERLFLASIHSLEKGVDYPVLKHFCNSMGTLRHPHLHFDMVRVGGGLYGVAACFLPYISSLIPAISLISSIAQVRRVKKGTTIGYNRRGRVGRDSLIGVIRIGYADGLKRKMGNGHGYVWLRNCRMPFIGSICMDFAMIDLTDLPIGNENELENEPVEIFGNHINIEEVAQWCDTIVFEFISTIGRRVKRSYIGDDEATNSIQPSS